MRWPVLLSPHPREGTWSLGERVSTRMRWLDDPDLPDDLVLHQIPLQASRLVDSTGQPWAQVLMSGGLYAIREGDHRAANVRLDGCLGVDAFLGIMSELPATTGIVRRVQVVQDLHDRGTDGWLRRPGCLRLIDVPDARPERLGDDPSVVDMAVNREPELDALMFLSQEQYFQRFRDRLPAERWLSRGFLVDLEVADPA